MVCPIAVYLFCTRIFLPVFDIDSILIFRLSSGHVCPLLVVARYADIESQKNYPEKLSGNPERDSDLCFQRLSTDLTASSWNPKELNASVSLDSACPPSADNRYVRRLSLMTGRPIRLSVPPPELQRQRSCGPGHAASHNLLNTIQECREGENTR